MSAALDELAEILNRELEITNRLLDLAKDARAAVVAADPELLAAIVGEQEEWSAQMEVAEARRVQLVGGLASELGAEGEPRLRDIIARVPREAGLRLRNVGRRLKDAAAELRRRGEINGRLLAAAAEHVDGFFAVLARACRDAAGYRRDGQERGSQPAAVLDRRA